MVCKQIEKKLLLACKPTYLDIVNESHMHKVPINSESHFKIVLVSDCFIGQRLLTRHRLIYGTLSDEMQGSVHALTLHAYTVTEWHIQKERVPISPCCHKEL